MTVFIDGELLGVCSICKGERTGVLGGRGFNSKSVHHVKVRPGVLWATWRAHWQKPDSFLLEPVYSKGRMLDEHPSFWNNLRRSLRGGGREGVCQERRSALCTEV